jgi:hypothetical protein
LLVVELVGHHHLVFGKLVPVEVPEVLELVLVSP